jgi:hypothetical protein
MTSANVASELSRRPAVGEVMHVQIRPPGGFESR